MGRPWFIVGQVRASLNEPDEVERRRWVILPVLCLSLVIIVLDNTIVNVALPTLARRTGGGLGATQSELQWIVDSYAIVLAGLLITAGSIGDRFGRYRVLAGGLVLFGTASVWAALADDPGALIAARGVMGIGAAFIMPSTLSILANVFLDPRERAKAIGVWAALSALGVGLGPVLGGLLLEHFWWGSVFLVNLPLVVIALVLGYLVVPESRDPVARRLDPLGAVLSITALVATLWSVIEGPSHGWTSGGVLGGFALGGGALLAFLLWERRAASPMLDLTFFDNPRFSAASGAIVISYVGLFGTVFLLTQFLQNVLGFSTVKAGTALLPQAAAIMVMANLSPHLTRRWGNKAVVAGGLLVVSGAFAGTLLLDEGSGLGSVFVVTCILGAGMGTLLPAATDSIMGSLPRTRAGIGSAINDTSRQVGGAVGIAVIGSLLSSRFGSEITAHLSGGPAAGVLPRVTDSISQALGEAEVAAPGLREQIEEAARASYVSGMHHAALVAIAVLLVGVAVVLAWLPARAAEVEPADGTAPVTDAGPLTPVEA